MKSTRRSLCRAALALTCLVLLLISAQANSKVDSKERERAVATLDELYAKYLSSSLIEARTNLVKAIAFIHESSVRLPELQSALPIAYARLSVLERKAGRDALSRLYFEKSRYWRLVEREKLQLKPEDIILNHESFTREDSDTYALEWDKKRTKGIGPAYLKEIQ